MIEYENIYNNYAQTMPADKSEKKCKPDLSPLPRNTVVAMAYVPFQQFGKVYASSEGIKNGTMFPELNKPFTGKAV